MLKVNGEELHKLVADACATASTSASATASVGASAAAHGHDGPARCSVVEDALHLFRLLLRHDAADKGSASSCASLPTLAITNGPERSYVCQCQPTPSGHMRLTTWTFSIQPLSLSELANPIGAGDTVSAVLCSHVMAGEPLHLAFAQALAAASASCKTFVGAEWEAAEQRAQFQSVRVSCATRVFPADPLSY